jgi:hypothetical protein
MTSIYAVYNADNNTNDSFGTNNGTAVGGLTYSTGKSGQAFTFNGSNAYISLPNNSLNSLTGDFTISMWIYLNSIVSGQNMCPLSSIRRDSGNYYGLAVFLNGGVPWLQISRGGSTNYVDLKAFGYPLAVGSWYNVICSHGTSGSKISINNVVRASDSSTANAVFHPTLNYCSIGAQQQTPSYQYWMTNGSKIDELYIWNRELTSLEKTELYTSGAGKFYPF